MTESRFERGVLDALTRADEVRVETRQDEASPEHGTIVWAVVVDDVPCLRSVRGAKGRWYREASAHPEIAVRVGDARVSVRAVPEDDAASIDRVSAAYREKYEASYPGPTAAMLREEALPTTLRLLPA